MIKPAPDREQSGGGLFLPDTAKQRKSHGTVVAIATDAEFTHFNVGDKVIFPDHQEYRITYKDEPYVFVPYNVIIAFERMGVEDSVIS